MLNQFEMIELDVVDSAQASVRRHPRGAYPCGGELQYCCNRCLCVHSYILTRLCAPVEALTYQFCCCRNARKASVRPKSGCRASDWRKRPGIWAHNCHACVSFGLATRICSQTTAASADLPARIRRMTCASAQKNQASKVAVSTPPHFDEFRRVRGSHRRRRRAPVPRRRIDGALVTKPVDFIVWKTRPQRCRRA
jgi:hypothetical protein